MDKTTNSSKSTREKKVKLKKELRNSNENVESDKTIDELFQETTEQHSSPKLKKKKKKRKIQTETKEDSPNKDFDTVEEPTKKKKKLQPKHDEEYKPGMLSDLLQMKKYGRVILPWDPSFGLDPKYSGKSR